MTTEGGTVQGETWMRKFLNKNGLLVKSLCLHLPGEGRIQHYNRYLWIHVTSRPNVEHWKVTKAKVP